MGLNPDNIDMSAGKGDSPRQVNREKYNENFDRIFRTHNGKFKGNSDRPRDIQVRPAQEAWRKNHDNDKP